MLLQSFATVSIGMREKLKKKKKENVKKVIAVIKIAVSVSRGEKFRSSQAAEMGRILEAKIFCNKMNSLNLNTLLFFRHRGVGNDVVRRIVVIDRISWSEWNSGTVDVLGLVLIPDTSSPIDRFFVGGWS